MVEMEKNADKGNLYHATADGYKDASKKESNKAAARRSRLKKKNAEHYNNEIRKKLHEENSKLLYENNVLRAEVERLNAIIDSHKNCPMPIDVSKERIEEDSRINVNNEHGRPFSTFDFNNYASIPNQPSSSLSLTRTNNKVYKILSLDPEEVNKSLKTTTKIYEKPYKNNIRKQKNSVPTDRLSKIYSSQTNMDSDTSQVIDLSFNDMETSDATEQLHTAHNICDRNGADILIQAMTHLHEKHLPTNNSHTNQDPPDEFVVQGSPGFVRVTSDSISVSNPTSTKLKFGKKLANTYL